MRATEPVPQLEQDELNGFLALALITPAYLGSIICWFALVWLTLLNLGGAPVSLPLHALLVVLTLLLTPV